VSSSGCPPHQCRVDSPNAASELLFGSLKVERLHGMRFDTRRLAKDGVIEKKWLAGQISLAAQ
jgi:hypothetical protein